MTSTLVRTASLYLLLAVIAMPALGAQDDADAARIEKAIDEARAKLDDAARKLAELHSQMWKLETAGPRADRPMLGILLQESGTQAGLALAGVTPEGGAEEAGLKAGDTIVEVNGVRLDEGGSRKPISALAQAMAPVDAGESVPVTYVRNGETFHATVVTQARGPYMARVVQEKKPWLESLRALQNLEDLEALEGLEDLQVLDDVDVAKLSDQVVKGPEGLRLRDVSGELARYFDVDRGVVVLDVPERLATLKPGDVLLDVDGDAVTDRTGSLKLLAAKNGTVPVRIKRHGSIEEVSVDADALNARQAVHVFHHSRVVRIRQSPDGESTLLEIVVKEDD